MKTHLGLVLVASLALAGCAATNTPGSTEGVNPTPAATVEVTLPVGNVDCSLLQDPQIQTDLLGIQVLAQLRSQDAVDTINDGVLTFDPVAFTSTLERLRVLSGHGVEGFGDPSEAVDFYEGASDIAAEILAVEGTVPQSMFDELIAYEGEVADFLYHQVAISAALDAVCG